MMHPILTLVGEGAVAYVDYAHAMMHNLAATGTHATETWHLPGATVEVTVAGDKAYLKITTGQAFEYYALVSGVWAHPMLVGILKDTTKKPVFVPLGDVSVASVAYLYPDLSVGKARRYIARFSATNVPDILFADVGDYSTYAPGRRQQLHISPLSVGNITKFRAAGLSGGGVTLAAASALGGYYLATVSGMPPSVTEGGGSVTLPPLQTSTKTIPLTNPYTGLYVTVRAYIAGMSAASSGYGVLATTAMAFYRFYTDPLLPGAIEISDNAALGTIGAVATASLYYYPPDVYKVSPGGGETKLSYTNPEMFHTHYMAEGTPLYFPDPVYYSHGAVRDTRVAGVHLVAAQVFDGNSAVMRFACFPVEVQATQILLTALTPFVFNFAGADAVGIVSLSDNTYIMQARYSGVWHGIRTQDSGATVSVSYPPVLPLGATQVMGSPWSALDTTRWVPGVSAMSKVAVMYTYSLLGKHYMAMYISTDAGAAWELQWTRQLPNANTSDITDIIPTNTTALGYT